MFKITKILSIITLSMLLLLGSNHFTFADTYDPGKYITQCSLTIRSDINTEDNPSTGTGICNGIIFGYYAPNVHTFNIYGMDTDQVPESGMKFLIGIPTDSQYTQAWVTVNTILIPNLPTKGSSDTPANKATINGEYNISGWFLDSSGVSKVEVLVDGKVVGTAKYGISRPDVEKVYPDYQNANAGYQYTFNTTKLTNGNHTFSASETGKNGKTKTLNSITANVQNLPLKFSIDTPSNGSIVSGQSKVSGWFLDPSGVSKVEILVDGKVMGTAKYGLSRPDVAKAYPQYKNANAGYTYTISTSNLTKGKHALSVKETGKNGSIKVLNSITIQKK